MEVQLEVAGSRRLPCIIAWNRCFGLKSFLLLSSSRNGTRLGERENVADSHRCRNISGRFPGRVGSGPWFSLLAQSQTAGNVGFAAIFTHRFHRTAAAAGN